MREVCLVRILIGLGVLVMDLCVYVCVCVSVCLGHAVTTVYRLRGLESEKVSSEELSLFRPLLCVCV